MQGPPGIEGLDGKDGKPGLRVSQARPEYLSILYLDM